MLMDINQCGETLSDVQIYKIALPIQAKNIQWIVIPYKCQGEWREYCWKFGKWGEMLKPKNPKYLVL